MMTLYKTNNSGQLWSRHQVNSVKGRAYTLTLDPVDENIIYMGGYNAEGGNRGAVYKSSNGGKAWNELGKNTFRQKNDFINQIAVDPLSRNIVYILTDSGLYKSFNFGASWQEVSSSLKQNNRVIQLKIHPKHSNKIYAATKNGVYYSEDRGKNWVRLDSDDFALASLCLAINVKKGYLFAGTSSSGVFRTSIK